MKKKLLSLLLALVMVVGLVPAMVIGVGADGPTTVAGAEYIGNYELPAGYTKYAYLSSDGTQAIATGIDSADDLEIEVQFRITPPASDSVDYRYVIATKYVSEDSDTTRLILYKNGKNAYWSMNSKTAPALANTIDLSSGAWHITKWSQTRVTLDKKSISTSLSHGAEDISEIYLFNQNPNNIKGLIGDISYVKIWKAGTLVRYFLPCENDSGELGMYDLVFEQFHGNASDEGEFSGTPSVANEAVAPGFTRVNGIAYQGGDVSGYNTGVAENNRDLSFDIDFRVPTYTATTTNNYRALFGSYVNEESSCTRLMYNAVTGSIFFNINYPPSAGVVASTNTLDPSYNMNTSDRSIQFGKKFGFIVDGETLMSAVDFETGLAEKPTGSANNGTIFLFAQNKSNSLAQSPTGTIIYGLKIYDGDELVRDYVPAVNNLSGVYGFYDKVNDTFLAGKDKMSSFDDPWVNGAVEQNVNTFGYTTAGGAEVKAENGLFYLPSETDYSDMSGLSFPDGTVIANTAGTAFLTVGTDELDFTELFGDEMEAGVNYSAVVTIDGFDARYDFVKSANLSALYLTLDGDIADVNSDSVTNKITELHGDMIMTDEDGNVLFTETVTKLKGRGNYSWTTSGDKKPYNLNIGSKQDLVGCGMTSKKWALNNHVDSDQTANTGSSGRWIGAHMGEWSDIFDAMDPAVNFDYIYVDLYINGDYRGNYMLMERVTADRFEIEDNEYDVEDEASTTRIIQSEGVGLDTTGDDVANIAAFSVGGTGGTDDLPVVWRMDLSAPTFTTRLADADADAADPAINAGIQAYQYATGSDVAENGYGGFVIEFARNSYLDMYEASWFITRRGQCFTLKSPEFASKEQLQTIAAYVQEMEDAIFSQSGYNDLGKYYTDYLDIESFAKQYLINTAMGNNDFMMSSTYLYIDAEPSTGVLVGKLMGDTAWDLQSSGTATEFINIASSFTSYRVAFYETQLLTHGDFVNELYEQSKEGTAFQLAWADTVNGAYADKIDMLEASSMMTLQRYGTVHNSYASYKDNLVTNMANRYNLWYNTFWNGTNNLLGVTASSDGTVLNANVTANSNATAYQWYKLEENGDSTEIAGATAATYTPTEKGSYYVVVTGGNMAYRTDYAYNSAILKSETIDMASNPVEFTLTDPKLSGSNIKKSLSPLENININIKVVNDETNDISDYTDFVLVVEDSEGNEVKRVDEWKWQGNTRYWCALPVLPQNINTVYNIHIEAKNELGEDVHGETFEYGVCTYCDNQIAKELGNGITQELKDLCTSIKAYGAAAKAYFDTLN